MIEMVTRAETRSAEEPQVGLRLGSQSRSRSLALTEIAPVLRGACAIKDASNEGAFTRFILEFRVERGHPQFRQRPRRCRLCAPRRHHAGPHHPHQELAGGAAAGRCARQRLGAPRRAPRSRRFMDDYKAYFARQNARVGGGRTMLDPAPRVALVPGIGLIGLGRTPKDAKIAADLAEAAVETITDAEATGRFTPIGEDDMFDCEYWPLEQAKLGAAKPLPLAGQIAVVTGGGGAIGAATAKLFAAQGAAVAMLDIDGAAAAAKARDIPGALRPHVRRHRRRLGDAGLRASGGCFWRRRHPRLQCRRGLARPHRRGRRLGLLRKSFELNFFAHQTMARAAVRIMLAQGTGGCLLFNVSKQAVNPGPEFRPLWPAQGRHPLPRAPVRARLRRRRHPRQRGQCRPHPLRPPDRRFHRGAGARRAA